jgi:hypothetical protein
VEILSGLAQLIVYVLGELLIWKVASPIPASHYDQAISKLEQTYGPIRRVEMASDFKILHTEKHGYLSWQPTFENLDTQKLKKSIIRPLTISRTKMLLKVKNIHLYKLEFGEK